MTILAGVACPEGVVVASDSRSTSFAPGLGPRVATDHARKLYSINDRYLVATTGWAYLGGETIAGAMDTFATLEQLEDDEHLERLIEAAGDDAGDPPDEPDEQGPAELRDVNDMAELLEGHFAGEVDDDLIAEPKLKPKAGDDVLVFLVAGYNNEGVGELKTVGLPGTGIENHYTTRDTGAVTFGAQDVWARLVYGYDATRIGPAADAATEAAREQLKYRFKYEEFALQDAIDFVALIVRTTIDVQRFADGTFGNPGGFAFCGGPIEIAAVTRDGVRWVQRTKIRSPLKRRSSPWR